MIQALAYTPGIIMVLFVVLGLIISSKKYPKSNISIFSRVGAYLAMLAIYL